MITSFAAHALWNQLRIGQMLEIVKLDPEGVEAARYAGEVVCVHNEEAWHVVRAEWTYRDLSIDGLEFRTGDVLLEWFSPECPFNAFGVFAPEGRLRGWYANVTYPAYLKVPNLEHTDRLTLVWHDLYLDLIGVPDGSCVIRDRDELDESGLSTRDPALYQAILSACDELKSRFMERRIPFATPEQTAHPVAAAQLFCADSGEQ